VVGAIGAVGLAACYPRQVRGRLRYAAVGLGVAVGVGAVLALVPLLTQFAGPNQVHTQIQDPRSVPATSDVAAFVVPTYDRAIAPAGALRVAEHFGTNLSEQGSYLGIPLLLLVLLAVVTTRRAAVRYFGGMAVVCGVLAMGARLRINGDQTGFRLPWTVALHVPLLRDALPARLAMYMWLFVGLLLACWLDEARSARWPVRATALVLLPAAAVSLLPIAAPAGPVTTPRFFLDAAARDTIPAGSPVVIAPVPTPDFPGPMMWDAAAGMRFRLVGGYFVGPAEGGGVTLYGQVPPFVVLTENIAAGGAPPAEGSAAARDVLDGSRRLGIRYWIVTPMRHDTVLVDFLSRALHQSARLVDDVWIVPVPR
jgi:hypothetical protein